MGGLRTRLPFAFWTFLIAGCSLAGLPLITAGAFSKDWIIWGALSAANGSPEFWIVALVGVLLTSLYTFRMIFLVFFGEAHSEVTKRPGYAMLIPCFVLAFLSIVGGYLKTPFGRFVETVLPWTEGARVVPITELVSEGIAALVFLLGLYLAYIFFLRKRSYATALASSPAGDAAAPFLVFRLGNGLAV